MKVFENGVMKVEIKEDGCGVVEIKKFGDRYAFRVRENGKLIAYSSVGLSKAMKAKAEFCF